MNSEERHTLVIEAIRKTRPSFRLKGLSEKTGMPVSTVYYVLKQIEREYDFLVQIVEKNVRV